MAFKVQRRFGTRGSSVTVKVAGTSTPAVLYADEAQTQTLTNPVTVSPNGFVAFAVAPGSYDLLESGNGSDKLAGLTVAAATASSTVSGVSVDAAAGTFTILTA